MVREGELLWTPSEARRERAQLTQFMRWLERERSLHFESYAALWRWSVEDLDGFWKAMDTLKDKIDFDRMDARKECPWMVWPR